MTSFISLFTLLLCLVVSTTTAQIGYTEVDDPRCHDKPNRPILEPTPTPTPFPPTEIHVYDETQPPTPTPVCPGMVESFQIVDLEDSSALPIAVEDGMTISLSQMPESFTVQAMVREGSDVTQVKFFVGTQHVHTDSQAPFYFKGDHEFAQLYVPGSYTISAVALASDGSWESDADACAVSVTVEYANPPGVCTSLVTKFALFDTTTQAIVPGYESLTDGQNLDLKYLPDHLSIVALTNGRGGDQIVFTVDGTEFATVTSPPYAITGTDGSGVVAEWSLLRQSGSYTIAAQMVDRTGALEDEICQITVKVTADLICVNQIEGFSLIDAETNNVIPGYEHMAGNWTIDMADLEANFITLRANKVDDEPKGVVFYVDGQKSRTDRFSPYSFSGDMMGKFYPSSHLSDTGNHVITAVGMDPNTADYEAIDKACMLNITITDTSYEKGGQVPPDTILELIDNDDGPCAPKLVTPLTVGNHMYYNTPVKVVDVVTDELVTFKVYNYILDATIDWITTSFVTSTGVEVCDKVENVAFEDFTEHVYEAKCHDGFAYADVFAYSSTFSQDQASADTTVLPDDCKNPFDGQVVRYTFVFSCNCEETPEIPDVIVGGVEESFRQCLGKTGTVMGDPHIVPFDGGQQKFDCMGAGEFVLAKATLDGYPYDFEAHGRFWKFEKAIDGSWISGIAIKQDVSVQLTIGESPLSYSNMYDHVPVNFYVNGEPRLLTQGSGDHRVVVTTYGYNVDIFFVTTGINVRILVEPESTWANIPGSFSAYLCIPNNNDRIIDVKGLLGNADGDKTNDHIDVAGNAVDLSVIDDFDYCMDNWCVRNEDESLFTFDEGYNFAHYNRCDDPKGARRLGVDVSKAPVEIEEICALVDHDERCLYDGIIGGPRAASIAVEYLRELEKAARADMLAEIPDEAACCSSNFRTCDDTLADKNSYTCTQLDTNDTFIWLEHGDLDEMCAEKTSSCSSPDECCPGLECSSGVCSPIASNNRRLEEFILARPDLPLERNIITYTGLL